MVFTGCIDAGGLLRAGGREFRQTALPHGVASPPQGRPGRPMRRHPERDRYGAVRIFPVPGNSPSRQGPR
jgi:hypothetical protein